MVEDKDEVLAFQKKCFDKIKEEILNMDEDLPMNDRKKILEDSCEKIGRLCMRVTKQFISREMNCKTSDELNGSSDNSNNIDKDLGDGEPELLENSTTELKNRMSDFRTNYMEFGKKYNDVRHIARFLDYLDELGIRAYISVQPSGSEDPKNKYLANIALRKLEYGKISEVVAKGSGLSPNEAEFVATENAHDILLWINSEMIGKPSPVFMIMAKLKNALVNPMLDYIIVKDARYFVAKSRLAPSLQRSIELGTWSGSKEVNQRFVDAFEEQDGKGPIYIFFYLPGFFCGFVRMSSCVTAVKKPIDAEEFAVEWICVKNIENDEFKSIMTSNNLPVTRAKDGEELSAEAGAEMINIFKSYPYRNSIIDEFELDESNPDFISL